MKKILCFIVIFLYNQSSIKAFSLNDLFNEPIKLYCHDVGIIIDKYDHTARVAYIQEKIKNVMINDFIIYFEYNYGISTDKWSINRLSGKYYREYYRDNILRNSYEGTCISTNNQF
jgi:hypothetical protein